MLGKISRGLLIASLVLTLGFHWTILQSVAWVGMIVEYSGQYTMQEAVTKTFDGQHPCPICKLVRAGKSTEGKSEIKPAAQRFDLFAAAGAAFYFPPSPEPAFFQVASMTGRMETPPLPPPRSAAAWLADCFV